jgi:hypothetical protein
MCCERKIIGGDGNDKKNCEREEIKRVELRRKVR